MKICLVLHKYSVSLHDPCCYPLGYMYVAAHLKKKGHKVKVLNYNLWDYDLEEEIKDCQYVFFTGFEEFKGRILRDSKTCHLNGIETMIGGALATFGGINEFDGYHHQGEMETCDIDAIPWPDYESFGIDEYHKRHDFKYMGILTSRGCPYSCTFCAQTCKFRMRNLNNVFDEIDHYIQQYKLDMIVFNDNTLNINKPRFMKICHGMKERNIKWGAAVRLNPMDEEMVIAASQSNCHHLVVGVETLNQEKLKRINKKITSEKILKSLDLLERHQVSYHGNILIGFEWETMEDISKELAAMPESYNLYPALVRPFIGTKNGWTRSITDIEAQAFDETFAQYAEMCGKTYERCNFCE